jgi:hypothetical protein
MTTNTQPHDQDLAPVAEHDDTCGFIKYAPNQPKGEPINGYTGYAYSVTFGGFTRGPLGHRVFIGVFPMHQEPAASGPYPGLR